MTEEIDVSLLPKIQLLDVQGRNMLDGVKVSNTPNLELKTILIDLTTGNDIK